MNSNININLRSIEAFKSISERGISTIEDQFELVNYSLGFPICNKDTIPDKIFSYPLSPYTILCRIRIVSENF